MHVTMRKLEGSDGDAYNWAWGAKYAEEVNAELLAAFLDLLKAEAASIPQDIMQQLAGEYASSRSGDLITEVSRTTQLRVREVIENAVREGRPLNEVQRLLREDFAFSKQRAQLIARTETTKVLGQGRKAIAVSENRNEKKWQTQGDNLVSTTICGPNSEAGWIPIGDTFPHGEDTIPGHPNCRCAVVYRTAPVQESMDEEQVPDLEGSRHG